MLFLYELVLWVFVMVVGCFDMVVYMMMYMVFFDVVSDDW